MKPEQINCLGCKSTKALFDCSLKKCASKRGVPTCAHCPDFPTCKDEQWTRYPEAARDRGGDEGEARRLTPARSAAISYG